VRRIIRGYRRRNRLTHQLMAECSYAALFAMRDAKGKTPKDLFPQIFEDDDDEGINDATNDEAHYTPEEVAEMQKEMASATELFRLTGTP